MPQFRYPPVSEPTPARGRGAALASPFRPTQPWKHDVLDLESVAKPPAAVMESSSREVKARETTSERRLGSNERGVRQWMEEITKHP